MFGDKFNKKRPNKRPRTEDLEATTTSTTTAATGNIQIIEADSQGKFVRLFNSGTKVSWKYHWVSLIDELRAEKIITFEPKVVKTTARNMKTHKICKLRTAIFSSFYNISRPNVVILLTLRCSFWLWG